MLTTMMIFYNFLNNKILNLPDASVVVATVDVIGVVVDFNVVAVLVVVSIGVVAVVIVDVSVFVGVVDGVVVVNGSGLSRFSEK